MVRNFLICLFCGASQLFAMAGDAPCSIQSAAAIGPNVWLLCTRDGLFASSDRGETWAARALPAGTKYRSIAFLDQRRGYIAGDSGTLLATADGGETWNPVKLATTENLTSIAFVGEQGWIAGWSGLILHSGDGGKTWEQQQSGVQQGLADIFFLDAAHGWAVGWIGVIVRTEDGGRTWTKGQSPKSTWSLESVYFTDAKNGWAVGFQGQILRSRDGGATWVVQKSPIEAWLKSVAFDKSGRGWIATDNELLVSENKGETWRPVPVQSPAFLQRVLPIDGTIWAVGQFSVWKQAGPDFALTAVANLPQPATLGGRTQSN
jgi:photosystem II stability/assembly factor-like uncharacterized protein